MSRIDRVNHLIQEVLAEIFEREVTPLLDCLVTVTAVVTSPDLRHAQVYISVYGNTQQHEKTKRIIAKLEGEIFRQLSRSIRLKYIPRLTYHLDSRMEAADRVLRILDQIEKDQQTGLN